MKMPPTVGMRAAKRSVERAAETAAAARARFSAAVAARTLAARTLAAQKARGAAVSSPKKRQKTVEEETRPPIEAMRIHGSDIAAAGSAWRDPIVDVTPADLVDAYVTEAGVIRAPFDDPLAALAAAIAARAPEPGPVGRAVVAAEMSLA